MPESLRLQPGAKSTVSFHNGDDFPNNEIAPTLARLREVNVVSASGKQPMTNLRQKDKVALADFTAPSDTGFLLTGHTIPNFIELQPKEFEDYLKHEHLVRSSSGERRMANPASRGESVIASM